MAVAALKQLSRGAGRTWQLGGRQICSVTSDGRFSISVDLDDVFQGPEELVTKVLAILVEARKWCVENGVEFDEAPEWVFDGAEEDDEDEF